MQKFKIEIIETLSKIVEVEAENEDDAIELVKEKYYEIDADFRYILTSDDYIGVDFQLYEE